MIESISKAGIRKKMIFNDSIILANKEDYIEINLKSNDQPVKFIFRFSNEGQEMKSTLNPSRDDSTFDLTLHKWNSTSYVESGIPWNVSVNGESMIVQFRVWANGKNAQRVFHLTIWQNNG